MQQSVENLARVWQSIDDLCSSLDEDSWKAPTPCPGWTVQDNISHLIDYESRALGHEPPQHEVGELPHVKNPLGQSNEIGVDFRRARSGAEVLAEFRSIAAERLAQLRSFGPDDFARPVQTPAGPGTVSDMLRLRVMDSWSHEQDIRAALGRPGHTEGPEVEEAIGHFVGLLPYAVGKKAQAPEGSTVAFDIGGYGRVVIGVDGGRAKRVDPAPDAVDVEIRLDAATFSLLVNGRTTSGEGVTIVGDDELGRRVVANLNVMI